MTILSLSGCFPGALLSRNHTTSFGTKNSRPSSSVVIKVALTLTSRRIGGSSCGRSFTVACLGDGAIRITDIIHNKVLIAAALSAAVGQLSKPFTSAIFHGQDFDIREAFQSGGFPSTHSSAAVATATSIGLERGFSDAVFGLAVVYAGIVMYDAQGVRREVGVHGKVLNRVLLETCLDQSSSNDVPLTDNLQPKSTSNVQILEPCLYEELSSLEPLKKSATVFATSGAESGSKPLKYSELKESIGHSEIEVIAGALLGFLVSVALFSFHI
ncbi:unnamed protein product [Cuscuta epithymum]|uniref:Acid phosphatase/vanadium-dependent haloperoxidase-related protein n=1 Tax=Cuscuta epithymum TaxID=186058 RepID=A0AAV0FHC5_9ASTE|nr:unnamed protein product [Cuscuta epithymum]